MTRREKIVSELGLNEIVQESIKRHPRFADKRVGFIDGAEWMQKKMIEKACEWLQQNAKDYVVTCYDRGELNDEDLLNDFKKAIGE